ncbi:MAG: Ig-like domain-containing protein, partial [Pseudobdellovibrionaceae bacterium]
PPPPPPSLAAPTNLRVVSVAYNQVKLQFDDSNSTESGFQVHRKIGSSGTLSQIGTTAAQSYDDNSVAASTQYCYQVKAYDSSSVSASSNEICATTAAAPAANVAPNVSITSPANGSSFSAGSSIVINASASDSDGSIAKVEFFSGSTKLGEDLTAPHSWTMSNVAAGSYSLTARATDNLGATRTSVAVSITVSSVTQPPPANVGPSVSITSPSNGSSFSSGMSVAINASASDSDGSVSKVEFFSGSLKLGEDLTAPYSLTMSNVAAGSYSLVARATDNAGAIANSAAVSITVNAIVQPPPPPSGTSVTLMTSQVPALVNLHDGVSYELGMRFTSTVAGKITTIRFFKGSAETGTRTGKIYSSSGALLASVVFSGETAAGWQQMNLASPLSIAANTEYTVSVNTGAGYYVATNNGMASQISNGSLRSVVGNNGVYGPVGSRPTSSYESSNYFRDIVFVADSGSTTPPPPTADTQAPVASITSPVNGALVKAGSVITISASASDNVAVTKVEIYTNGNLRCTKTAAPYSCSWTVPKRVGRTHQIQVKAYDAAGNVGSQTISVKSN